MREARLGGFGACVANSLRLFYRAVPRHQLDHPLHLVLRSRFPISIQNIAHLAILLGRTSVEQIDHHQRALALGDIAAALLAIAAGRDRRGHRLVRVFDQEIEQIIADLKRDRNGLAKIADHPLHRPICARDHRAHRTRPAPAVPPGLAPQHFDKLVYIRNHFRGDPPDIQRLPLKSLLRAHNHLAQQIERGRIAQNLAVGLQNFKHLGVQRVSYVDAQGNPVHQVQTRLAAPHQRRILDIVVNEREGLEQLKRRRGSQSHRRISAKRANAQQHQCGPKPLAPSLRIIAHGRVQKIHRLFIHRQKPIHLRVDAGHPGFQVILQPIIHGHRRNPFTFFRIFASTFAAKGRTGIVA